MAENWNAILQGVQSGLQNYQKIKDRKLEEKKLNKLQEQFNQTFGLEQKKFDFDTDYRNRYLKYLYYAARDRKVGDKNKEDELPSPFDVFKVVETTGEDGKKNYKLTYDPDKLGQYFNYYAVKTTNGTAASFGGYFNMLMNNDNLTYEQKLQKALEFTNNVREKAIAVMMKNGIKGDYARQLFDEAMQEYMNNWFGKGETPTPVPPKDDGFSNKGILGKIWNAYFKPSEQGSFYGTGGSIGIGGTLRPDQIDNTTIESPSDYIKDDFNYNDAKNTYDLLLATNNRSGAIKFIKELYSNLNKLKQDEQAVALQWIEELNKKYNLF